MFKEGRFDINTVQHILFQSLKSPDVRSLELTGLHIDQTLASSLLQVLRKRNYWERLTLVGCTGRDLFAVFTGLSKVHSLYLTGVALDYEAFCTLSLALKHAPNLTSLSLTWLSLHEGITPLAESFACNHSLERLILTGCNVQDDHLAELFSQALTGMQQLNLEDNHCHAHGSVAISKLLQRTTSLVDLNLSEQSPTDDANYEKIDIRPIAQAVRWNQTLRSIDLSYNCLNDTDLTLLATALIENVMLMQLELGSNLISDIGISSLATSLVRMRGLKRLHLTRNPFSKTDELLNAVKLNLELEELEIDLQMMNFTEIQYYLTLNKGGRRLLKSSTQVPLGLWPLVLERSNDLKWNTSVMFYLLQGPVLFERAD